MFENREFGKVSLVVVIVIGVILLSVAGSAALMLNMSYFETGILEEQTDKYQYIADDITNQISSAESVFSRLESDDTVTSILNDQHVIDTEVESLYQSIDLATIVTTEVDAYLYQNLTIYTTNPSVDLDHNFKYATADVQAQDWYFRINEARRSLTLYILENELYFLYRLEIPGNTNEYTNIGIVKLDHTILEDLESINSKVLVSNGASQTVDDIYGVRKLGSPYEDYLSIFESDYLDDDMVLLYDIVPGTAIGKWSLLITIDKINFISEFLKYASIIFTVISVVVLLTFYRFNYIQSIDKSVNELSLESIQAMIATNRPNKIDKLVKNMYAKMESLIQQNQELDFMNRKTEAEKNEAEIKALISQISPHYIFNLLNSIQKRALKNNEMQSARMILLMSKQLRHSLQWKEPLVSIKDEIEHIKSYIELQQYYYGTEFEFKYEINDDLYESRIPKLLYQTLIENAIKHGIKTAPYEIKLDENNNRILFTVSNSVEGNITDVESTIKQVLLSTKPLNQKEGIGLHNMSKRLQYYYGNNYQVTINTDKQKLSITIDLPKTQ